jgi:predicted ATPase
VTGQVLTLDDTLQDTLPALLALLDVLPPDSPFGQLDPPQRRQCTLDALKRVLLRESQVQPLLLVCEDLHWSDAETQALLDSVVSSLPTARMLLVNYRPEYQRGRRPPDAARCPCRLPPLTQMLIARTEGNPFFLEESARTLVETGVLVGEPGAYRLAKPLDSLQVPATVHAVLAARIDRLPPEEKRLLECLTRMPPTPRPTILLPVLRAVSSCLLWGSRRRGDKALCCGRTRASGHRPAPPDLISGTM